MHAPVSLSDPSDVIVHEASAFYSDQKLFKRLRGAKSRGVEGVDLSLPKGKVVAVIGENGSGKTSLLKAVSDDFKAFHRAKSIGAITIGGENFTFREAAQKGLILGAYHHDHKPNTKLLGEAQRFAMGEGNPDPYDNTQPALIVMDEPTRNLDTGEKVQMADYINRITGKSSVLIAAHDIPFVLEHADHVVHLQGGAVTFNGPVSALNDPDYDIPEATRDYVQKGLELQARDKAQFLPAAFRPAVDASIFDRPKRQPSQKDKLIAKGISVTFNPSDREKRLQAVGGVDLQIKEGETFGIIGPSGCGKSTVLKSLNDMLSAVGADADIAGEVLLDGIDMRALAKDDPVAVRTAFGYVAQKAQCWPHMQIYKELTYAAVIHGLIPNKKEARVELAQKLLRQVGLWKEVSKDDRYLNDYGPSLSGGQQQRLSIGRSISAEPRMILMDEPCSALDPIAAGGIEELISEFNHQGVTIAIVTHDMAQGARICNRVGMMYLGEMVEVGPAQQVYMNPQHEQTRRFVGKMQ